jgi:hypothetical protein
MDKQTDSWLNRLTDTWSDNQMDRQRGRDKQKDKQTDSWMDRLTGRCLDKRMDRRTERTNVLTYSSATKKKTFFKRRNQKWYNLRTTWMFNPLDSLAFAPQPRTVAEAEQVPIL